MPLTHLLSGKGDINDKFIGGATITPDLVTSGEQLLSAGNV